MPQLQHSLPLLALAIFIFFLHLSNAGEWPEDCGKNKTHNFYFGRQWYYDRLLYVNHTVKARSSQRKLSYDLEIPPKGVYQSGVITYIEVLDQYRDGNGGCAYLKPGTGIGYRNVTLHIESQWFQGINFVINVYGH